MLSSEDTDKSTPGVKMRGNEVALLKKPTTTVTEWGKKVFTNTGGNKMRNKKAATLPNQLFTVSLIQYICDSLNPKNPEMSEAQFQGICHKLINFNVISETLITDTFRPVRFQYQKILHALLNQRIVPQIEYHVGGMGRTAARLVQSTGKLNKLNALAIASSSTPRLNRSISNEALVYTAGAFSQHKIMRQDTAMAAADRDSDESDGENVHRSLEDDSEDEDEMNRTFGRFNRYYSEFVEIEKLASGGFGSVYKARNQLDEKLYAVKKIYFKNESADFQDRVLREIKLISSLDHDNIVSYHSSWIELGVVSNTSGKHKHHEESSDDQVFNTAGGFDDDEDDEIEDSLVAKKNDRISFKISSSSDEEGDKKKVDSSSSSSSSSSNGPGGKFFRRAPPTISADITTSQNGFSSFSSNYNDGHGAKLSEKDRLRRSTRRYRTKSRSEAIMILYIQMQLCDFTLRDWLNKRNHDLFNTSPSREQIDNITIADDYEIQCISISRQIVSGVEYIHSKSIIHRDLKPNNIFLVKAHDSDDLRVKIGDFGLACLENMSDQVELPSPMTLTVPQDVKCQEEHTRGVGTSLYASPEQLTGKCYDSKSDIFSLGIVLFELYCPFSTDMERILKIQDVKSSLTFPSDMLEKYPQQCEIIKSLLNKVPCERPSAFMLRDNEIFLSKDEIIDRLRRRLAQKDSDIKKLLEKIRQQEVVIKRQETDIANYQSLYGLALD